MATIKPQPQAEKRPQKFISFSLDPSDIRKVEQLKDDGWAIVRLVPYGNQYVGIIEKFSHDNSNNPEEQVIYIPPKKKISFK